mmetsp:Transcript_20199/g.42299  ORF Transcript_20199/g.42299 Transcript_20199/m.42299 type:complete len:201 (+) Transcript_20199:476-1078(+)
MNVIGNFRRHLFVVLENFRKVIRVYPLLTRSRDHLERSFLKFLAHPVLYPFLRLRIPVHHGKNRGNVPVQLLRRRHDLHVNRRKIERGELFWILLHLRREHGHEAPPRTCTECPYRGINILVLLVLGILPTSPHKTRRQELSSNLEDSRAIVFPIPASLLVILLEGDYRDARSVRRTYHATSLGGVEETGGVTRTSMEEK